MNLNKYVYWGEHPENGGNGTILKLLIVFDNFGNLSTLHEPTGEWYNFCKWPKDYFGDKLNGPFSSPDKAKNKFNFPLPKFDEKGKKI